MNKSGKIFIVSMLLIFAFHPGFSQNAPQLTDTLQVKSKQSESSEVAKEQEAKENNHKQTVTNGVSGGLQKVKQVRGGRPDMSKAGGARPPLIVRPAGSGIPRGVGKPAGAGRHGGR